MLGKKGVEDIIWWVVAFVIALLLLLIIILLAQGTSDTATTEFGKIAAIVKTILAGGS